MGVLMVGAGACRSSNAYKMSDEEQAARPGRVVIHVINNNVADMDVYVVGEGRGAETICCAHVPTKLGTVNGSSYDTFYLDRSFPPTSTLRILATGGSGRASSRSLTVSPGQTIDFTIASALSMSSATIR